MKSLLKNPIRIQNEGSIETEPQCTSGVMDEVRWNHPKKITLIRQEIRESNDSKKKSKDKTATGKQYPSLNKSAPDIRKTLTALSHIQGIAIISDLFDNEDSITDMEMDTDGDDFSEHICQGNMVSVHGGLWGDDDMIDIQATYRFTNK